MRVPWQSNKDRSVPRSFIAGVLMAAACLSFVLATPVAASGTITLLGQLDLAPGSQRNSDIWGWVDPMTSKEYAIVGEWQGGTAYIVDVSDPANPTLTSTITLANINNGFDLKTWGQWLYLVDGGGTGNDGVIYDISDPVNPDSVGTFLSAHNIFITQAGIMYNEIFGLSILDVAANPTAPAVIWTNSSTSSAGHDATVVGNILYDFHGPTATRIYDVTNPAMPLLQGSIENPADFGIRYHHSGWPSADGNFLFVNDELAYQNGVDGIDMYVFDISDPMNWTMVDSFIDSTAIVHNSFRVGNYLHTSFYTAGYRVFDISDPSNMQLCDEFDTSAFSGVQFEGCWGVYPFAPSGVIYVSDQQNGLYLFEFNPIGTAIADTPTKPFTLDQNFPNPFNPVTTIAYSLDTTEFVEIGVYNSAGQRVRDLVGESRPPGQHRTTWDATDNAGRRVASGVYFYRLTAGGLTESRRMVLLK